MGFYSSDSSCVIWARHGPPWAASRRPFRSARGRPKLLWIFCCMSSRRLETDSWSFAGDLIGFEAAFPHMLWMMFDGCWWCLMAFFPLRPGLWTLWRKSRFFPENSGFYPEFFQKIGYFCPGPFWQENCQCLMISDDAWWWSLMIIWWWVFQIWWVLIPELSSFATATIAPGVGDSRSSCYTMVWRWGCWTRPLMEGQARWPRGNHGCSTLMMSSILSWIECPMISRIKLQSYVVLLQPGTSTLSQFGDGKRYFLDMPH